MSEFWKKTMAKIRHHKLADEIQKFRDTAAIDTKAQRELLDKYPIARSDKFYDDFVSNVWLRHETAEEQYNRWLVEASAREDERAKHRVFYEQYQCSSSMLNQNLLSEAAPIYQKWLLNCPLQTRRGYRTTKVEFPFQPFEKEQLFNALQRVTAFIKNKPSRHYKALAVSYHGALVEALFRETGICPPGKPKDEVEPAYGLYILRYLGYSLERTFLWTDLTPLTILPGRYPISQQRATRYIKALVDWYLSDPRNLCELGETILTLWILLACAFHKRRFCAVADIFKVQEAHLKCTPGKRWHDQQLSATYGLKICGEQVPFSYSLLSTIMTLSDGRSKKQLIIQIDRSTMENHLRIISERLAFDPDTDPVTPETFLERPHSCGENLRSTL